MIARHGYLTLSRDRQLVIDQSHRDLDEGIILAIIGNKLHAESADEIKKIPQVLIDTLEPQTNYIHWARHCASKLHTQSIGTFLCGTHLYIRGHPSTRTMTIEWVDRFRQQVIHVNICDRPRHGEVNYDSYIIPTNRGYFVMPVANIELPRMRCYKIENGDTTFYLRELLHYYFPAHSYIIFEDEPFCKNLPIMYDIIVKCAA